MFTRKPMFAALALGAFATAALAAAQDPDVAARQEAMGMIGSNMKKIGSMAKGEVAFDEALAQSYFTEIATIAGTIPTLFTAQSNVDPEAEARDILWVEWDKFTAMATGLQEAAQAGTTVDSPEALGAAMGPLGQACKTCHSAYKE